MCRVRSASDPIDRPYGRSTLRSSLDTPRGSPPSEFPLGRCGWELLARCGCDGLLPSPTSRSPWKRLLPVLPFWLPLCGDELAPVGSRLCRRAARFAPRASPPRRPIAAMCSRFLLTVTPPLRPAARASPESNSWAVPFWCAARPPLLVSRAACCDPSMRTRGCCARAGPTRFPGRRPCARRSRRSKGALRDRSHSRLRAVAPDPRRSCALRRSV